MSSNIKHEAVFPPALYSLRRMTHQSPPGIGSKGSYELYDPKSAGEKMVNGLDGFAPGSPGSVKDYKQVVANLQRELEDSKRKGSELQQIIADLNTPLTQSGGSVPDNQFIDASPPGDSLGESVKDAHIKHLQRQVTILQANLYKSEGWANRVANSMKERDRAVDDVTRLTNHISNMEGDNKQLQQRVETLSTALQETQQNLRQVTEELQSQIYNGQIVSHLRDEIQRQKAEIMSLKQLLAQLDQENRSLKDSGVDVNSQASGSLACSQELEHLHLVVDKLRRTVIEQRDYLLQLKKPNRRNARSASTSSSSAVTIDLINQDVSSGRISSSPTPRATGGDGVVGSLQQQIAVGQYNQLVGLKPVTQESKKPLQRNVSAPNFYQETGLGIGQKLSSRDVIDEVFNLEDLNLQNPLPAQGEGFVGAEQRPNHLMTSSLYQVEGVRQKSPDFFKQHGGRDVVEKSAGQTVLTSASGSAPAKTPLHRTTQSEVLVHRHGLGKVTQDNWGSKSEIISRQASPWNNTSGNRSSTLPHRHQGVDADKYVQVNPGLALNQMPRRLSARSNQQEMEQSGHSSGSTEHQGQLLNGGSTQMMMLNSGSAVLYENINRKSPTFQNQQIYHPPTNCQQGSVSGNNYDIGGKQPVPGPPAPCPTPHRPATDVVYVNTLNSHGLSTANSSSVDPDPSRARLNSDRLCPVCSNDYGHVTMEEFQTHVFECFDDENAPETMKPQATLNRFCPMCNARFGPETTQPEFEKHVHGHFGEDCVGDNFEMLNP